MFGLGIREIIIIVVILILLFGAKRIPELARSIVDAVKQLRGAFKDEDKSESISKKK